MSSQLRRLCWLLMVIIIAFSGSLCFSSYRISPAQGKATTQLVTAQSAAELEAQGKYFYAIAQFQQAVDSWQEASKIYGESDPLSQARILGSLALAQSQLNQWTVAKENINAGLDLLRQNTQLNDAERGRALGQLLNNQGILSLNQGRIKTAIALWDQAEDYYQQSGAELGVIRTAINQAGAYKQLGFYHRALKILTEVEANLKQQPDSLIKVAGLRSYGDLLRLTGQVEQSRKILHQSLAIAEEMSSPGEEVKILLVLGNTYKKANPKQARKIYQQGQKICQQTVNCWQTDLPLQLYLAQINLMANQLEGERATKLIATIKAEFLRLPLNRVNIDRKINFAPILIKLAENTSQSYLESEQFLQDTIEQTQLIGYGRAQSYGWGLLGQIREKLGDWKQAQDDTQQALTLAQKINAPEVSYLWQWQLGRINQVLGERQTAIAHYTEAVAILQSLSQDLAASDPDIQYSFRDQVEPVYRELVSLLLTKDAEGEISQTNLETAREVIESLQLAELNNFFRAACIEASVVDIDQVDPQAAVIYPIILSDRLEVILSLPDQPLKHYTTPVNQPQLEAIIEQFRESIVVRSRRDFYQLGTQLYDLMIRPALKELTNNQIKTLVFVTDASFQNLPFSALSDGQRFLLEDYSIALNPGLQLLNSQPLAADKLNTIAAGLTAGIKGFSPLDYVHAELKQIESRVKSVVLLNQNFTIEALQQEIEYSDYPIVHIATHGQFSSAIEDTFLLAWDQRIKIQELERILQTRNTPQAQGIELLVLSACETATGDRQAALGLAGIAVRAGAKSTLATLWSVNDRATAKLMSNFYYQLAEKHLPKAEAVRQAQLSLLGDRSYRHPFYWAPYVLLGNWL